MSHGAYFNAITYLPPPPKKKYCLSYADFYDPCTINVESTDSKVWPSQPIFTQIYRLFARNLFYPTSWKYNSKSTTHKMQQFLVLFISINYSTCFRRFLRPSSGAQNCTCSVRYCQTSTAASCYRGWDGTQFHLIHGSSRQQYWSDYTWRSMFSFVLLMMDGGTAWNM